MKIINYKILLGLSTLLLSACGVMLLSVGFWLFFDSKRILISRLIGSSSETLLNLSHPFFYYVALGLAAGGLIAIFISFIGWWAICLQNFCVLSVYFLAVLLLLLFESSFCSIVAVWPQCLGLNLDESLMVKILQSNYGIPGKEQLTTSIDLVQTNFKCCSINSHLNYDMALWRLQNYGTNLVVPKTCCILANDQDATNYLDPMPENLTLCQSLLKYEYNRARHKESCIEHLIEWYTQHYTIFLMGAAIFGLVQIFVILSVIFSCIKMHKRKRAIVRSTGTTMQSNVLTNNKRPAPQPQFQQPTNNIHNKPTSITRYSYNLSNSYLV